MKRHFFEKILIYSTILPSSCYYSFIAEVIQKNLEPLRENVEKKKRAQDAYYETHEDTMGMSPLTREAFKKPVKQRLGRRHIPYVGTSTSFLPPKKRLRKIGNTLNNTINIRKIRNDILHQRSYSVSGKYQEAAANRNRSITKLRLRRPKSLLSGEPKNFQVEIINNNVNGRHNISRPQRFRQILNNNIQLEIKKLQLQYTGDNVPPTKITPAFTLITISERFARLI